MIILCPLTDWLTDTPSNHSILLAAHARTWDNNNPGFTNHSSDLSLGNIADRSNMYRKQLCIDKLYENKTHHIPLVGSTILYKMVKWTVPLQVQHVCHSNYKAQESSLKPFLMENSFTWATAVRSCVRYIQSWSQLKPLCTNSCVLLECCMLCDMLHS